MSPARVPARALNVAEVDPAATVIEAGRVSAGLLLESAIVAFPLGAAPESVTVHVDVAPEPKVLGEHCKLPILTWDDRTETVPPVPLTIVTLPVGDAPAVPVREIGSTEPLVAMPRATVAVATVPLPIGVAFIPLATQLTDPPVALH